MPVTKTIKQHITGWWPVPTPVRGRKRLTGELLKQIVEDLEAAEVPLSSEIHVERESGSIAPTGFRLRLENVIQ